MPKAYTPVSAAADLEKALRVLEGRWKLVILFRLFGGKVMRFSDLERAMPRREPGLSHHTKNAWAAVEGGGGGWHRSADVVSASAAQRWNTG